MKPNPSEANNHDTDLELISPDILEGMEIPVLNIEHEYVANTGSKYALEKLLYFAELSLNIPAEWRDANGNPVPDFISCINTAYIVLAYTNSWGEFKDGKEQGYYTDAEYTQELKEDNEALCGRIEK
ncbi:MAG TPA: hypothetical protein VHA74_00990, partial [Candidatus Dojkabacteria bacterium]|nr:hypothetical protein [Candidatus Dojkabacteria bacterium]